MPTCNVCAVTQISRAVRLSCGTLPTSATNFKLSNFSCRVISSNPDDRVNIDELDKQGHRGCRGLMPENTVVGMLKALELGVTTLEMDTVITKDGHVILSHEPFFNHEITTSPEGAYILEADQHNHNIYRMIYSEIKQYDVGLKLHPRFSRQQKLPAVKPLLRDVFTAVKSYCQLHNVAEPFYNIETKTMEFGDNIDHPVPSVFVDTLMRVIEDAGTNPVKILLSSLLSYRYFWLFHFSIFYWCYISYLYIEL